jgi:phosphatidylglycerophosphate synthase
MSTNMIDAVYQPAERRPLASRNLPIFQRAAAWLIARGVSGNAVSLCSIVFAALASLCLVGTAWTDGGSVRLLLALAAFFVQARLLANLLDGMVAVGSGQASPEGELYNEVPDRLADALILIGAGLAAGGTPALGYLAAIVAIFVAYVRALGGALGVPALFIGPMAKPQRMATITAACLYSACVPAGWIGGLASGAFTAVDIALALIVAGGVLTAFRRLHRIASQLRVSL